MCGICGLWQKHEAVQRETLAAMNQRLHHRGPDGDGFFLVDNLGLAMRRLAIIDVEGGWQPLYNEDKTLVIVFNGEIYNYVELKAELEARGHRFATHSDTETILHAYEEYGLASLERLNGMFAFALWDSVRRRLWVARDRLGEKPLYYAWTGQQLAFASELRALAPALPQREIDPQAIHHYLAFQHVPSPYSVWRGVQKLPPAHYFLLEGETLRVQRYWQLDDSPLPPAPSQDVAAELRQRLRDSVRIRLRSDMPLGAFLSGGFDSAVVVATMADLLERPVQAFTVAFQEKAFDEAGRATILARAVGAEHHIETLVLRPQTDLAPFIRALDEPFADGSALATYYIARFARQHVTVALSGDGGDEIFGGYQRYTLDDWAAAYAYVPAPLRAMVDRGARRLPLPRNQPIESNWVLGLRRLHQVMRLPESASILRWGSYFSPPLAEALYTPDFARAVGAADSLRLLSATYAASQAGTRAGRTLYTDTHHYLPDNGLVKTDRMSMAHGLELRAPLLDPDLVSWMARLPSAYKVRGRARKILLRQAFAPILPPDWASAPKRGFEIPLGAWLRGDLSALAQEALLGAGARTRPWFRGAEVQRLWDEQSAGRDDHSRRLWALLVLELWLREGW